MLDTLIKYFPAFVNGAVVTLSIAVFAWISGVLLGCICGFLASKNEKASKLLFYFSMLIGSVPVIAILFWFHYPFQVILGLVLDPFWVSCFVLSMINILFVSDSVNYAARQIPKEYLSCSRIYGLNKKVSFLNIELPMILRASVPSILTSQVTILHMTLFASLISVPELFRTAQRINAIENNVVEIYTLLAIFYLVLSMPLIIVSNLLKKRFNLDMSER